MLNSRSRECQLEQAYVLYTFHNSHVFASLPQTQFSNTTRAFISINSKRHSFENYHFRPIIIYYKSRPCIRQRICITGDMSAPHKDTDQIIL